MKKETKNTVQIYSKETLHLKKDIPGVKMFAVSLKKTMLSYFEIEINCRFEKHSHKSEQITMVLEGELYFEVNDKVKRILPGEIIAIPPDIEHAVFTKNLPVKAVDAWSPVMEKYLA